MHPQLKVLKLDKTAHYILSMQQPDGAIIWCPNQKLDPWDHVEAAMGLCVAGYFKQAKKAYDWLKNNQASNGSWNSAYFLTENGNCSQTDSMATNNNLLEKNNNLIETNFVAYSATGIWHYFRQTNDFDFLSEFFPCVIKAIDFVLKYQSAEGEIAWAINEEGIAENDALLTACSSIARSLECAIHIGEIVLRSEEIDICFSPEQHEQWKKSYFRLAKAITEKPQRFDRTWESKQRFAMDWYYPILAGLYPAESARERLNKRWDEFVETELGCRCVNDEPWVTMAETSELAIALIAANDRERALALFATLAQWQQADGGFVTGYVFRDNTIWPEDKTTWTCGAVLLAADALFSITSASTLFTQPSQLLDQRNDAGSNISTACLVETETVLRRIK